MSSHNIRLRVGILIVSDTAHANPHTDRSLTVLSQTFANNDGGNSSSKWQPSASAIVPDDVEKIQGKIKEWCDQEGEDYMNLIVTSGGTGFAVRDVTPEAVGPLIEKHAPGLVYVYLPYLMGSLNFYSEL